MSLLLDIFGFLSVVLRGFTLAGQSATVGGVLFLALVVLPFRAALGPVGPDIERRCRVLLAMSALVFALSETLTILLQASVLMGSLDIGVGDALAAGFAQSELVIIAASLLIVFLCRTPVAAGTLAALLALSAISLVAQVGTSHAAAQLDNRVPLALADFAHMLAAAAWLGGIPYFLIALHCTSDGIAWRRVGKRFSNISAASVALLLAGGIGMAVPYIGSVPAIWGTAYGVMVVTKALLLLALLFLGGMNFLLVERLRRDPTTPILRLKRFAEVEIGLGLTVLFAAASLTSQPPGVDLTTDRASWHEIVERNTPHWPRFSSPDHASLAISELDARIAAAAAQGAQVPQAYVPGEGLAAPRNAMDTAWSEYNHHWAGIFVLAIGILSLLERTGRAPWAAHWPLLFLGLALFLFFRSDPEVWPLGDIGFLASLRDPEIVQHRLFVVLIVAFGFFEWCVRTGRLRSAGAALVFPLITAAGGMLLFAHSHALANIKDQLLIEITHVPLALAGMTAGWARWIELRLPGKPARIASWIWPAAFVVVGIILILYREA